MHASIGTCGEYRAHTHTTAASPVFTIMLYIYNHAASSYTLSLISEDSALASSLLAGSLQAPCLVVFSSYSLLVAQLSYAVLVHLNDYMNIVFMHVTTIG